MLKASSIVALALLASCAAFATAGPGRPAIRRDGKPASPPLSVTVPIPAKTPAALETPAGAGDHAAPALLPAMAAPAGTKSPEVRTVQPLDGLALAAALQAQQAKLEAMRSLGSIPAVVGAPDRSAAAPRPASRVPALTAPPLTPTAPRRAQVPMSIAAAQRLRAGLPVTRATPGATAGTTKPLPVITRIPGTPLNVAQRAKLERALAAPVGRGPGAGSAHRDEGK